MRYRWSGLVAIALSITLTLAVRAQTRPGLDSSTCTYRGRPLSGRVQVVDHLPDLKIAVVTTRPDLRVRIVSHSPPNRCGEWQFVEQLGQLRVQFVEHFSDLRVQFVTRNSGF